MWIPPLRRWWCRREHGGIDLAYMQQLSGKTQEELVKDLSGLMFRVPGMGTEEDPVYQTAEEYLSGNVRQKLEQARQGAALGRCTGPTRTPWPLCSPKN